MGRKPRIYFPGAFYHLMNRGNRRQPLFHDEQDYQAFLRSLSETSSRYQLRIHVYCLMPKHFHLLAEVNLVPPAALPFPCATHKLRSEPPVMLISPCGFPSRHSMAMRRLAAEKVRLLQSINPASIKRRRMNPPKKSAAVMAESDACANHGRTANSVFRRNYPLAVAWGWLRHGSTSPKLFSSSWQTAARLCDCGHRRESRLCSLVPMTSDKRYPFLPR
jgi:hypothetical protein